MNLKIIRLSKRSPSIEDIYSGIPFLRNSTISKSNLQWQKALSVVICGQNTRVELKMQMCQRELFQIEIYIFTMMSILIHCQQECKLVRFFSFSFCLDTWAQQLQDMWDLPESGIKMSPTLAADSLPLSHQGSSSMIFQRDNLTILVQILKYIGQGGESEMN